MDQHAGLQSPHRGENIEVRVDDGDDRRSQHEDRQRDGVCGHVAPIEHADEGLAIEDRLVETEQRRTAHHRHADPREDHPALTSGFRLYGLVSQRFPAKVAKNVAIIENITIAGHLIIIVRNRACRKNYIAARRC